ncbi:MAG: caspase family protein, partial [Bacteroidetes bacterium]|nr:caspase family protein [Bacteroidota bacterium]
MRTEVMTLAPDKTEMVVKGNHFDKEYNELERLDRAGKLKFLSPQSDRYLELRDQQNTLLTSIKLPGGQERQVIDTRLEIISTEYHPGGEYLYVLGMAAPYSHYTIKKYETDQWKLIEQYEIKKQDFYFSGPMKISPDGSKIAIPGGRMEKDQHQYEVFVFDLDIFAPPALMIETSSSELFRFHSNGNYIAVLSGNAKGKIDLYDTHDGQLIFSANCDFFYAFHPTKDWLMYLKYDEQGRMEIKLVDIHSSIEVNSWQFDVIKAKIQSVPVFGPDGDYLVYADDVGIKYLELEKRVTKNQESTVSNSQKGLARISNVFLHPEGNQLMLQIPDVEQGKIITLNNVVQLNAESEKRGLFYLDKQWQYKITVRRFKGYDTQIELRDYVTDQLFWEAIAVGTLDAKVSPSGKYVVLLGLNQKGTRFYNFYEIRDIKTGKLIKKLPANYGCLKIEFGSDFRDFLLLNIPKKCGKFQYSDLPADYFDLNTKRKKMPPPPVYPALVQIPDGIIMRCWDFELPEEYPAVSQPFSIKNGEKIVTTISSFGPTTHELKIIDTQGLGNPMLSIDTKEICDLISSHFFDLNDKDSVLISCFSNENIGDQSGSQELVFRKINIQTGKSKLYAKFKGFALGYIYGEISSDAKYLFLVNIEGSAEIWHLPKSEKLLTIYATLNNGYLLLTPDGYYFGTKGALENVRFSAKDQSLPFQQYDLKYNRPDIILSRFEESTPELVELYRKAYEKRMEKMGFDENRVVDENHFPEIKVTNSSIPPYTDEETFEVFVKASDSKYALDRINIWVNDVPVLGRKGRSIKSQQSKEFESSFQIPLTPGENQFRLSVMNEQGVESLLENFSIECRAPKASSDLYLISIGVSEYANPEMNLSYAAKDAQDISRLFSDQKGHFAHVYRTELLNREVTRSRLQTIKSALQKTKPNDAVVLYLSGHGLIDEELDYYLATYDVDF